MLLPFARDEQYSKFHFAASQAEANVSGNNENFQISRSIIQHRHLTRLESQCPRAIYSSVPFGPAVRRKSFLAVWRNFDQRFTQFRVFARQNHLLMLVNKYINTEYAPIILLKMQFIIITDILINKFNTSLFKVLKQTLSSEWELITYAC